MEVAGVVFGIGYGNRRHIARPPEAGFGRRANDHRAARFALCSNMVHLDYCLDDPHLLAEDRLRIERMKLCGSCAKHVGVERCQCCGGTGLEPLVCRKVGDVSA